MVWGELYQRALLDGHSVNNQLCPCQRSGQKPIHIFLIFGSAFAHAYGVATTPHIGVPYKMQASSWHRVETIAISANCNACHLGASKWLKRYEFTYLRTNGVVLRQALRKTVAIYRHRSNLCTIATKSADHRQSRIMVALPMAKHRRRLSRMELSLRRVR